MKHFEFKQSTFSRELWKASDGYSAGSGMAACITKLYF